MTPFLFLFISFAQLLHCRLLSCRSFIYCHLYIVALHVYYFGTLFYASEFFSFIADLTSLCVSCQYSQMTYTHMYMLMTRNALALSILHCYAELRRQIGQATINNLFVQLNVSSFIGFSRFLFLFESMGTFFLR